MQYCTLGRTGLKVSRLGFGAMRLPMTGPEDDRLVRRHAKRSRAHVGSAGGLSLAFGLYHTTLRGNALQPESQREVAAAPTRRVRASFGDIPSFRRKPLAYG